MKILTIRGCNLASIEGEFEIDFTAEPLRSAGLFAITGHTGSGKSTILDALCLALYAKTPRSQQTVERVTIEEKNNILQDDPRLILRKGTGQGWAEVDFRATNGDTYRSRWSVARAYNKPTGNLQSYNFSVINLSSHTEIQGNKSYLIEQTANLIGLTYDQFTRSVLLAQNEFATFLKAKDNEKAAILEKLTGLDIYSTISIRIFKKYTEAKDELNLIESHLQGIQLLSEEDILLIKERQQVLEEEIGALQKEIKQYETKLKWWQDLFVLEKNLTTAGEALMMAKNRETEASARKEYLQKAERARDIAPAYNQWQQGEADTIKKQKICVELEHTIGQLNNILKQAQQKEQEKNSLLKTLEAKSTAIQPELAKARELDSKLEVAQNNATKEQQALNQHLAETDKNKEELRKLTNQLAANEAGIKNTASWFEKSKPYAPMVQHHSKIITLLDQLSAFDVEQAKSQEKVTQLNVSLNKVQAETDTLKETQIKQQAVHEADKKEAAELKERMNQTNLQQLRQEIDGLQQQKELLNKAQSKLEALLKSEKDKIKAEQELNKQRELLPENEKQLAKVQTALQEATIKRDEAEKLYKNAQLATDKVVVNLRSELQPNMPCPVCGSREHHMEAIGDAILQSFRNEYEANKQHFDDLNQKQIQLTEQHKSITIRIGQLQEEFKQSEEQYEKDSAAWQPLAKQLVAQCNAENVIEPTWLENEIASVSNALIKHQQIERELTALATQLQASQNLIGQQQETILKITNQLRELEKQQSTAEAELKGETTRQAEAKERMAALTAEIGTLVTIEGWQAQWQQDAELFKQKINRFVELWQENEQHRQELEKARESLNGQQQTLKQAIELQETKTGQLQQRSVAANELVTNLTKERKGTLDGKSADAVEKELRQNIQQERQQLEELQKEYNRQKSEFDRQQATLESTQKEVGEKREQTGKYKQQVGQWCESQQPVVTAEELTHLMGHPAGWFQEERAALDTLSQAVQNCEAIVKEREHQVGQHRSQLGIPDAETETPAHLEMALQKAKEKTDIQGNQKADLLARLQNDGENKKRFADIQKKLEQQAKVTGNWKQLNDMLGSSNGDAFRKIAQGYTLDALLRFANQQLRQLTARYRLERIGDTLALQVIDMDMCDERRPALSLSGGESFLISLALALGLSSLASDRISVESLFIDEGFGSLDIETLRTAMEALSNLQTQGRKIGVISHVQEMTESIAVRVNVEKGSQGSSRIHISTN